MSKKAFFLILVLSVVVTWLTKEVMGVLNFTLGGLNAGLPFNFYQCSFISSCNINYVLLVADTVVWFMIILIIWKLLQKNLKK